MDDPSNPNQGGYKARHTTAQVLYIALRMALTFSKLGSISEKIHIVTHIAKTLKTNGFSLSSFHHQLNKRLPISCRIRYPRLFKSLLTQAAGITNTAGSPLFVSLIARNRRSVIHT
jgi:hypothetical protein